MTLYAIGDIQGCAGELEALLQKISFNASRDHLWLVGDLVNRGPDSLAVLRRIMALQAHATVVLGNHDLHLLATAAGARAPSANDTFGAVLEAPDAGELLDWIRHRPLVHHDAARTRLLVHAGVPPCWSVAEAIRWAREVTSALRSKRWRESLQSMYGNQPAVWSKKLTKKERRRFTINALTRMRYCDAKGRLDFEHSGEPGTQPAHLMPWFDVPGRLSRETQIVFGHWAALGVLRRADVTALDSGCVWGGGLTAIPLEPPGEPVSVDCAHLARRGIRR